MLVGIFTDTHWCARKSSKLFQDYFELFYKNIFFPTLKKYGVETVIHMGDAFDNRKSIDFSGLDWTRRVVLEPLSDFDVHMVTGNHDVYFRNTNSINSPELLLKDFSNIKVYSKPTEIKLDNLGILLLPWICADSEEESFKLIKNSNCQVAMGHLELQGFRVNHNMMMEHGLDYSIFKNFKKVFSGHFHTRSDNGLVYYIGNPYEIYWNDFSDTRGFVIFDTETLEHFYVDNPYKMFHIIHYEDTPHQMLDVRDFKNKIVKLIVKKKSNTKNFDKFIDKLYSSDIADLKVIENFDINFSEEVGDFESENTLSILQKYASECESDLNKDVVNKLLEDIYKEALEIV